MSFAQTLLDVWHGRSEALPRELLLAFAERQGLPEKSDWALGWDTPTAGRCRKSVSSSPVIVIVISEPPRMRKNTNGAMSMGRNSFGKTTRTVSLDLAG